MMSGMPTLMQRPARDVEHPQPLSPGPSSLGPAHLPCPHHRMSWDFCTGQCHSAWHLVNPSLALCTSYTRRCRLSQYIQLALTVTAPQRCLAQGVCVIGACGCSAAPSVYCCAPDPCLHLAHTMCHTRNGSMVAFCCLHCDTKGPHIQAALTGNNHRQAPLLCVWRECETYTFAFILKQLEDLAQRCSAVLLGLITGHLHAGGPHPGSSPQTAPRPAVPAATACAEVPHQSCLPPRPATHPSHPRNMSPSLLPSRSRQVRSWCPVKLHSFQKHWAQILTWFGSAGTQAYTVVHCRCQQTSNVCLFAHSPDASHASAKHRSMP